VLDGARDANNVCERDWMVVRGSRRAEVIERSEESLTVDRNW
jgi:hypothetical protein